MTTSTMQNTSENKKGKLSKATIKRKVQARANGKKTGAKADGLAANLYHQGRDAVSNAYDSAAKLGAKAGRSLPHLPNDLHLRSRGQSVYTMMEERPIVMGAVGLGVGMVLAALLPSFSSHRQKH